MNAEQEALLKKYADAVMKPPPYLHLTSEKDQGTFFERHVTDAIKIHDRLPPSFFGNKAKVADVGTGNGVPGVVLAILEPLWNICMIDSDSKKSGFIESFCNNNAINNARMLCQRAEEIGRVEMRSACDLVFARALGKLPMVLEVTAPLAKVGGLIIVPHGTSWGEEWGRSQNAAKELGLSPPNVTPYDLCGIQFFLAIFKKESQTSDRYPRRFAQIKKKPL